MSFLCYCNSTCRILSHFNTFGCLCTVNSFASLFRCKNVNKILCKCFIPIIVVSLIVCRIAKCPGDNQRNELSLCAGAAYHAHDLAPILVIPRTHAIDHVWLYYTYLLLYLFTHKFLGCTIPHLVCQNSNFV